MRMYGLNSLYEVRIKYQLILAVRDPTIIFLHACSWGVMQYTQSNNINRTCRTGINANHKTVNRLINITLHQYFKTIMFLCFKLLIRTSSQYRKRDFRKIKQSVERQLVRAIIYSRISLHCCGNVGIYCIVLWDLPYGVSGCCKTSFVFLHLKQVF